MAGAAGRRASATRNRRVRGHRAAKLKAGLIDEIHLALAPTLLGRGEALLTGIDMIAAGFRCTAAREHAASDACGADQGPGRRMMASVHRRGLRSRRTGFADAGLAALRRWHQGQDIRRKSNRTAPARLLERASTGNRTLVGPSAEGACVFRQRYEHARRVSFQPCDLRRADPALRSARKRVLRCPLRTPSLLAGRPACAARQGAISGLRHLPTSRGS